MTPPRNIHEEWLSDSVTVAAANVDTDANGDVQVTFPNLRRIIESETEFHAEGGYVANVQSVGSNVATVRLYYGAASGSALAAVVSTANVTILHGRTKGE